MSGTPSEDAPALARNRDRAALGYSRPHGYEELRAVLSSGTTQLPKKLRQVAIFLWQHPTVVALGTVTSVAAQAGVQPSTLVRFAQTFGYSGFSDLQEVFKIYLREGGADASRELGGEAGRLVEGFIKSSTLALSHVAERLDERGFEAMADAMARADLLYVLGAKRAFPAASYVALALSKLDIRTVTLDNVGSAASEQLRLATPRDAVLAFSFTPYNSVTPELAASVAERGVPVVSVTDSAFSPLVRVSRAYVEVVEEGFSGFKTLAATLAVSMALVLRVAQLRGVPDVRLLANE